jgi:hypothetical protein
MIEELHALAGSQMMGRVLCADHSDSSTPVNSLVCPEGLLVRIPKRIQD